jgi:hypothetical protein
MKELPTFTETFIRALPRPAKKRKSYFSACCPGLGVKISHSGRRVFIVQGRMVNGEQTTRVLGQVGSITLVQARELANQFHLALREGKNPNMERQHARANTVEKLVLDYIALELKRKRDGKNVAAALREHWLGQRMTKSYVTKPHRHWQITWAPGPDKALSTRPIVHVTKQEILARLDNIRARDGDWAARRALAALRRAFAWAARDERYGLKISPAAGLRDETVGIGSDEMRRDRTLTNDEIRAVWTAAGELGVYGVLVKLLFLTAARREEWGSASWSELTPIKLVVPKTRFKGRGFELPHNSNVSRLPNNVWILVLPRCVC